jgi:hypothetical protein
LKLTHLFLGVALVECTREAVSGETPCQDQQEPDACHNADDKRSAQQAILN